MFQYCSGVFQATMKELLLPDLIIRGLFTRGCKVEQLLTAIVSV